MLHPLVSHNHFQEQFRLRFLLHTQTSRGKVVELKRSLSKLFLLNLNNIHTILIPLYSNTGHPARDPVGIVRSLILMMDLHIHSLTTWAVMVQNDPILQHACGFFDGNAPGIGTYYDFIDRLLGAYATIVRKRRKVFRKLKVKPKTRFKKGEKQPPKHTGIVGKLFNKLEDNKLPTLRLGKVLHELLARAVVDQSAAMGLLGDTQQFSFAADGTPYHSGACSYGRKECDCYKKGIYKCDCPRRFTDPDASWGWDSYREEWYYGDSLFIISAANAKHDLPVHVMQAKASRHDSTSFVFSLQDMQRLYPSWKLTQAVADGSMDNYPTYRYLCDHKIIPIIPLDSNAVMPDQLPPGVIALDNKGRPICEGGIPYTPWGFSWPKANKHRCWFAAKGIEAPCKCTDSSYGRVVYLKPDFDVRLFPPIPRESTEWRERYNTRTTVERCNKRIFNDYAVENGCCRSSGHRLMRAVLAAINIHLDAWLKYTTVDVLSL